MRLSDINPALYNPRKDLKPGDSEYEKMKRSIDEFDCVEPLVWNKRTERLVGGHQRLKILKQKGVNEFEVSVVDLDENREKALNVALNKIQGDWDFGKLADLMTELDDGEFDLELTGFDMSEIEELMNWTPKEEEPFDAAAEAEKIKEPKSKRGEIYRLGRHRLMCGDATSREDMEGLMDGEKADMGLTSPPYAVGKEYEENVTFNEHLNMLDRFAQRSLDYIKSGGFLFINFGEIAPQSHTNKLTGSQRQCLYPISKDYWAIFHEKYDFDLYAMRIWYKPFNRLQQPFWTYHTSIPHHQEWEWLWTWRLPGGSGDRVYDWDISVHAVWDTRQERTEDRPLTRHVAAFPICLPERALKAHSQKNDLVWDGFGGSGTTLIACEQLNRRCFMMEIDPIYCDVILNRWEKYTGERAGLIKQ